MKLPLGRLLFAAPLAAGLAWCASWSVSLARGDFWARRETLPAAQEAIACTPQQAVYHVRLAKLLADTDLPRSRASLRQALALDSWDANSWIDLGLDYEAAGDLANAERCLLQAAAVDRQYLPRWTLTNYYFRRGEQARFWQWARSSAEMIYGDPVPLFRLCGVVEEDGRLIDRLGIRKPALEAAYLTYLLGQDRLDLIGPSAAAVLRNGRETDVPPLLSACDSLLSQSRVAESLEIWNRLAAAGRISGELLDPAAGRSLTNGAFAAVPLSSGFDWRLPGLEGVAVSREDSPAGLRLTFSGRQPESCEPLVQVLPVRPNTAYRLTLRYRTSKALADSGLRWRVAEGASGALLAESASLSSVQPADGGLAFLTPFACRSVRLALACQRMPGTVRFEGFVTLYHIGVDFATTAGQ